MFQSMSFHGETSNSPPPKKFLDTEPRSSLPNGFDRNRMLVNTGLTKIENLKYRIGYLTSFVSAMEEAFELFSAFSLIFRYCSEEVVELAEKARKTLESAGVVPYLWASCPENLLSHKQVYVQLLQNLHSNERYVAPQLRKRLRALLMPLTSRFSIAKNSDVDTWRQHQASILSGRDETPRQRGRFERHEAEIRSMTMPPPFSPPPSDLTCRGSQVGNISARSIKQRLWTEEELMPYSDLSSSYRDRDEEAWDIDDDHEEMDEVEVSVPEEEGTPFRLTRPTLRFGICFTRKTSSHGGSYSSHGHSQMNYKE